MNEEGVERKLTTILAADVVGYSRLMGKDKAGTLTRLKSLRKELVQPKTIGGRGRIVKHIGDGLLAEFPSVIEAVPCVVDIQQDMAAHEAVREDNMKLRTSTTSCHVSGPKATLRPERPRNTALELGRRSDLPGYVGEESAA